MIGENSLSYSRKTSLFYRFNRFYLALMVFYFFNSVILYSQAGYYNPKDDQYRLLGLKRAKETFENAKIQYDRQLGLFEKKLISNEEYQQAKLKYSETEVNYHQALLAVLFEQQYIIVTKAIKYQTANGQKHVRVSLENSSQGSAELRKLVNIEDPIFRSLQPDVINNVYVSLLNKEDAIISQPYEIKIDEIRYGKPATIDFIMLQDLDAVKVSMIYGSGTQRTRSIFLQKDATVNKVIVQSEQFSQEVELGKSATFAMTMELFSGAGNTYKLEVANLPKQINNYFYDALNKTRLSQIKFLESTNTRKVELQVFLPDRPVDEVGIDKTIQFYVLVIPENQSTNLQNLLNKQLTQNEIESLNVGYVKLELIPKGSGKLLIRAPQWYYPIYPDESLDMYVEVVNDGSRRLDNIEVQIEPPLNWAKQVDPAVVNSLDIREEKKVLLKLQPPQDITVGKYEVRLRTTSLSNNQPVNAEDKTITVEIKGKTNVLWTAILIILIIGVILGIVIYGIRLSKK